MLNAALEFIADALASLLQPASLLCSVYFVPLWLYEADLGDGYCYMLCRPCLDLFRWQRGLDKEPMQEERQLEFAV